MLIDNTLLLAGDSKPLAGETVQISDGVMLGQVVDLGDGSADFRPGEPITIEIIVTEVFATGTLFGLQIKSDGNATPTTVVWTFAEDAVALWVVGRKITAHIDAVGRYTALHLTVSAADATAGAIVASIQRAGDRQSNVGGVTVN